MKTKIWKVLSVGLTLGLLLSLAVAPAVSVSAATQSWSKVTMPATASGTDVGPIVVGPDGALYAAVKDGTTYDIMKSTDGGYTWTATPFKDNLNAVVDIAVAPDGTLYVGCAGALLYRVTGTAVELIKPIVDSSGDPAGTIYSVDVWNDGTSNWVMVATDKDVLVLKDALFEGWRDQELDEPAYWAGFAPDFTATEFIWAVYNNGTTAVITATKSPGQWGNLIQDIVIGPTAFAVNAKSDVAFVDGYASAAPVLFAALNKTGGPTTAIYRCETGGVGTVPVMNLATIPGTVTEISNLVYTPSAIYAGVGNSALVIRSTDGGDNFAAVTKSPTGASDTYVALLPSGAVVAATSGDESAFSYSEDGLTFNQISYIDTAIDAIVDVAFRPTDNSALMLTTNTVGTNTSLWRTLDRTASTIFWERVALDDATSIDQLVEYSLDGVAAFWYDGGAAIKRSTNNAQSFNNWKNLPAGATLNDWVMPNNATIYAALSTGFWGTTQFGSMALTNVTGAELTSIDLSGSALVVGDEDGNVFYSANKGYSGTWEDVSTTDLTGDTYVSFAEGSDVMVYAAAGNKLMRLTDASAAAADLEWVPVTDHTGSLATADAIVTAPGAGNTDEGWGMAYVTSQNDEVLRVRGVASKYETIGKPTGATALSGLWYTPGSNVLWSIATVSGASELWTYTDILNVSGSGVAVSDVETITFMGDPLFSPFFGFSFATGTITFNALPGADDYKVVVNTVPQTNFYTADDASDVDVDAVPGATTPTYVVTDLAPATTYYVSVWANDPVSSFLFGGAPVSFSTPPAAPGVVEPFLSPEPGARNVPTNPTFQWMPVDGAAKYEFQLSTDPSFTGAQTVSVTGSYYAAEGLEYDTAYYWRVRAVMADDTASAWVTSVFSTMAEPVEPPPPQTTTITAPAVTVTAPPQLITLPASTVTLPASTVTLPGQTITAPAVTVTAPPQTITMPAAETPTYVWAVIGVGALLVIAVIVLIVRTRRAV